MMVVLAVCLLQLTGGITVASAQETRSASSTTEHDPPMRATVEFENDSVRVVRIHIAPHQKLPMHDVTPRVVIWLTDANLRMTFPDGQTHEVQSRAGETSWVPRGRHAGENLSAQPIEFIAVILKTAGPSSRTSASHAGTN